MRILFNSYAYPNAGQPQLATFNRTMLAGLSRQHAVRVVAPVPFVQRWKHCPDPQGYRTLPDVQAEYPAFYYTPKLWRDRYDEFLWWSTRGILRRTIAEFRPDVVLSYWAHPDGAVAVRAAREAGLPAVVMVGGSDVLVLGRSGRRRRVILQTLADADGVIAVSEDIASTLRDDGIAAGRITVVPRGIDRDVFRPGDRVPARRALGLPEDREIVIGVGRLVDVKDWPTWIDACGELHRRGRRIACYVLGGGPLAETLQRQIHSRGWNEVVVLKGPQSQSALAQWYRAADLTVLSSRSEGVPNVLLETIASGGSFAATNVGGIPEIADPVYDRLTPPENSAALADAIADRLDHPPPRELPRRFEPDSPEQTSQRLTAALVRAVHGNQTPSITRPQAAAPTIETLTPVL